MTLASLLLLAAITTVDLDAVIVPLSSDVRVVLAPMARAEMKHEGTVSRIRIDADRIAPPSMFGAMFNTYVVWAVSPEGVLDNLGELEIKNGKAQFGATTRFNQFGVLVTAEPHYMIDKPSSAVVYRSQAPETDFRKKTVPVQVGTYDYSQLKVNAAALQSSVSQARAAFAIAQSAGADRLAPLDFRNAQVAIGALEELVNRSAPLDILWPTANEAIRLSQRAATTARAAAERR